MTVRLLRGDCIERMGELPESSIDAIVTDPPYGLEFMGKDWDRIAAKPRGRTSTMQVETPTIEHRNDSPQHRSAIRQPSTLLRCVACGGNSSGAWNRCSCEKPDFRSRSDTGAAMQAWHAEWLAEAFRVLKPGGYLLAFGGTRTFHRLTCAIEDAGFEIRDCLTWLYGSGFPKSLDVSKAMDKAAGVEREVIGERRKLDSYGVANDVFGGGPNHDRIQSITAPATDLAREWQGWGTALKPAWEPIVLARKPLIGAVAANVERYGTGAINVDGCRIGVDWEKDPTRRGWQGGNSQTIGVTGNFGCVGDRVSQPNDLGRWPANVCLDEEAATQLDQAVGILTSGANPTRRSSSKFGTLYGDFEGQEECTPSRGAEAGGPSRFFFVAHDDSSTYTSGDEGELPCKNPLRKQSPEHGAIAGKMDAGIANGESQEVEKFINKSRVDGFGSKSTDPSQTDTKSTTQTSTEKITTSPTWSALPLDGTTTTISDGARTTKLSESVSIGAASGAMNTDPSLSSSEERAEPTKGIASSVHAPISENGESATESTTTHTTDNIELTENRFFYTAKASSSERNKGLEGLDPRAVPMYGAGIGEGVDRDAPVIERNHHPTVKPLSLMRWLVRLVTPPAGVVLDPFMGSGTTGIACVYEEFGFVGIEKEEEYLNIAKLRIERAQGPMFAAVEVAG